MTKTESNNFYFLVKTCGISPLDIPYMTPLQEQTLIYQHNKYEEEKREALEEQKKKSDRGSPKKSRKR